MICVSGERLVHGGLDTCSSVLGRDVANGVRSHAVVWIVAHVGAVVLLDALCQSDAVRSHDGAALNVRALSNGVIVGRERLKSRCVNDHQEGQVAEKNGEEEGKYGNQIGQTFSESNTSQNTRFLRLQTKASTDVAAMQNGRGVSSTRRNFKPLGVKCFLAWFKLCLATSSLVTCPEQQGNNDKAGKKRATALTHKGQGNAGKRHELSNACNNEEGLERQNTGKTSSRKSR